MTSVDPLANYADLRDERDDYLATLSDYRAAQDQARVDVYNLTHEMVREGATSAEIRAAREGVRERALRLAPRPPSGSSPLSLARVAAVRDRFASRLSAADLAAIEEVARKRDLGALIDALLASPLFPSKESS